MIIRYCCIGPIDHGTKFSQALTYTVKLTILQGSGGVTIKKTGQALIFGLYDEPVTPGQCNMIVERMGDYLIDQGL